MRVLIDNLIRGPAPFLSTPPPFTSLLFPPLPSLLFFLRFSGWTTEQECVWSLLCVLVNWCQVGGGSKWPVCGWGGWHCLFLCFLLFNYMYLGRFSCWGTKQNSSKCGNPAPYPASVDQLMFWILCLSLRDVKNRAVCERSPVWERSQSQKL